MKDTIKPRLIRMEEKLNEKLTPKFDDKLFVSFDDPVPLDKDHRLREKETNLKTGYSSINMEREQDNKDSVPWGDKPILNQNLVPLGERPPDNGNGDMPDLDDIADRIMENLRGIQ
jgi:hypothetical protein